MSSSPTRAPTPEGPGTVSQAPNLPAGFTDTFTSRYVHTGGLRLHAVTGGDDILLYREAARLPLGQLPQLGPIGQDAYYKLVAVEHFTPHVRRDIAFRVAGG